tara:strand:+ start:108708 stop:108998 length:291 start_codon:yes stop_codon:yes gene_type:complete
MMSFGQSGVELEIHRDTNVVELSVSSFDFVRTIEVIKIIRIGNNEAILSDSKITMVVRSKAFNTWWVGNPGEYMMIVQKHDGLDREVIETKMFIIY